MKKENREAKVDGRCDALAAVLESLRPIYKVATLDQQDLIETMIGAAIWYIPKPNGWWTGMVSKAAIQSFHPDRNGRPKMSEEHVYPRKLTARQLLLDFTVDGVALRKLYREKYCKIHFITPAENKVLVQHQRAKTFITPDEAYIRAGVELVYVTPDDLKSIKKRNKEVVEHYV